MYMYRNISNDQSTNDLLTQLYPFFIPDELASELSSKSGSPSPIIHHGGREFRDFRESSVASTRSSLGGAEDAEAIAAGVSEVTAMRDERYPSPFSRHGGSMTSLGVSKYTEFVVWYVRT